MDRYPVYVPGQTASAARPSSASAADAEKPLNIACSVRADRIVIGRRGKDFVARMLMGSGATRVVQYAPCDVLVVA